ncbi:ABC transporter permease [Hydrogenophaga sp.]|uniref:MlaE family ABC transporter permease n=1 Tax=Hydrogenophaga sp. TaxID=1904254 RepID=UPI00261921B3|nr:ABC transporter permease [Hydrogenophaga sp.]MCW5655308.1 ABC transporter permease [Hydrogenophaga sp.]
MNPVTSTHSLLGRWGREARASWRRWWHVVHIGAQIVVLALSPSSHAGAARRRAVFTHLHAASAPLLTGFLVLSALVSLVLIRIVVATAYSYGLSQYALEVLVRTLVLELIPLYAAMFVAARYTMPEAQVLRQRFAVQHGQGVLPPQGALLASVLLPRALAAMFSVALLAALSCVVALVLTYLTVYGFSPWGLVPYTRSVGQVFSPTVTLIFSLKTLFFSLAVAVVPLAASAQHDERGGFSPRSDMSEFARLFSVVLLIEITSLVGNYY